MEYFRLRRGDFGDNAPAGHTFLGLFRSNLRESQSRVGGFAAVMRWTVRFDCDNRKVCRGQPLPYICGRYHILNTRPGFVLGPVNNSLQYELLAAYNLW